MDIRVEYDGEYPNLCSGTLTVFIGDVKYDFGDCLSSGGSVSFDEDWFEEVEEVEEGPWHINTWPSDFPDGYKQNVIDAVNEAVPLGCCGGCV